MRLIKRFLRSWFGYAKREIVIERRKLDNGVTVYSGRAVEQELVSTNSSNVPDPHPEHHVRMYD